MTWRLRGSSLYQCRIWPSRSQALALGMGRGETALTPPVLRAQPEGFIPTLCNHKF